MCRPPFHSLGLGFRSEMPSSRLEFQAILSKQGFSSDGEISAGFCGLSAPLLGLPGDDTAALSCVNAHGHPQRPAEMRLVTTLGLPVAPEGWAPPAHSSLGTVWAGLGVGSPVASWGSPMLPAPLSS